MGPKFGSTPLQFKDVHSCRLSMWCAGVSTPRSSLVQMVLPTSHLLGYQCGYVWKYPPKSIGLHPLLFLKWSFWGIPIFNPNLIWSKTTSHQWLNDLWLHQNRVPPHHSWPSTNQEILDWTWVSPLNRWLMLRWFEVSPILQIVLFLPAFAMKYVHRLAQLQLHLACQNTLYILIYLVANPLNVTHCRLKILKREGLKCLTTPAASVLHLSWPCP